MTNFFIRLIKYQYERFPLFILLFTTYAVVSSSFTVVQGDFHINAQVVIGFIIGLLFMFQMRLFDEAKDFEHDKQHYPSRPVVRGLITLTELKRVSIFVIFVELVIVCLAPVKTWVFFFVAFLYSLLTKNEFFLRNWVRQRFFIYNISHYLQTALYVVYLYALAGADFNLATPKLWIHFIFTVLTLTLLEWARKMRTPAEENNSKDTYSAQLGVKGASLILSLVLITAFIAFKLIAPPSLSQSMLSALSLVTATLSIYYYMSRASKASTQYLQLSCIVFFVLLHVLV